ncbi:MAG: reverse transcriptase family protein [Sedimentisphaerales bacterium]|jgi:RNA-directed DNA polymerase
MNSKDCVSPGGQQAFKEDVTYKTLRIRYIKHLPIILGVSLDSIQHITQNPDKYYREFELQVKGKDRVLVESIDPLKTLQRRILHDILLRIPPSASSFGGTKGRSIKDNAMVHRHSQFIVKLDIKNFYPSIHNTKVYEFFISQECSPDVAHILTKLTTRNHALPLGTSTSPFLADQIVRPIDSRISAMAKKVGLKYTRYVDDITLSGNFELERITGTVMKVLKQSGFKTKKEKLIYYKPGDNAMERIITGVGIINGRISAPLDYVNAFKVELKNAIVQSRREKPEGEFKPREHYHGKITYIKWLDPNQGNKLMSMYRKVKWQHLEWALRQSIKD